MPKSLLQTSVECIIKRSNFRNICWVISQVLSTWSKKCVIISPGTSRIPSSYFKSVQLVLISTISLAYGRHRNFRPPRVSPSAPARALRSPAKSLTNTEYSTGFRSRNTTCMLATRSLVFGSSTHGASWPDPMSLNLALSWTVRRTPITSCGPLFNHILAVCQSLASFRGLEFRGQGFDRHIITTRIYRNLYSS